MLPNALVHLRRPALPCSTKVTVSKREPGAKPDAYSVRQVQRTLDRTLVEGELYERAALAHLHLHSCPRCLAHPEPRLSAGEVCRNDT